MLGQAMHDDVVDERSLGIKHGRILRLADGELRRIVHRDVLNRFERLRAGHADVAHVADVENANAAAHGEVFFHQSADRGVLDRHVPAIEVDHLGSKLAMDGVQSGLADCWNGLCFGSQN